jgi:hypothetical protein
MNGYQKSQNSNFTPEYINSLNKNRSNEDFNKKLIKNSSNNNF